MFSLIITIIAIALVAALALATIYYGGSAFNKSAAAANAAKLANQSQQLLGALTLYRADHGAWPQNTAVLIANNYLKSNPVASATQLTPAGAAGSAFAQNAAGGVEWVMLEDYNPTFVLVNAVDAETCRATNKQMLGQDGILKKAYATYKAQCYGDANMLKVVITADPALFASGMAATAPGEIASTTPPTDAASPDWYVAPGAATPGGSSAPDVLALNSPSLSFDGLPDGNTRTVNLTNTGTDPLVPSITTTTPAYTATSDCGTLNAGDSCTITVTVHGDPSTPRNGSLVVTAPGAATESISLSSAAAVGGQVTLANGCSFPAGFELYDCPIEIYLSGDGPWGNELINVRANRVLTSYPTISLSMPGVTIRGAGYHSTNGSPYPSTPTTPGSMGGYDASIGWFVPAVELSSEGLVEGADYTGTLTITTEHGTVTVPVIFHNRPRDLGPGGPPGGPQG